MERQLSVARRANDDSTMREAFAAVRSLCEVVLGGESKREEKAVLKTLTTASAVQSITSFEGKLLEEEDANGGSLFDF